MPARYRDPRVHLDAAANRLTIEVQVENAGAETWRGASLGAQIHDAAADAFVADAQWLPLPEMPAGGSAAGRLEIELPRESGEYRVLVSVLDASERWLHQHGSPMVVVDASVDRGSTALRDTRITTADAERRSRALRSVAKALTLPFVTPWRNRSLIRSMVRRDILSRYRGSFGDVLWTVLNPLLLMATYFFVFRVVLRARFEADPSPSGFALYFLAGMLPWLGFSEAVGRAPHVVLEHRNFVKKLVFPVETLNATQTVAALATEAFALGVFLVFLLVARGYVPWTVAYLPLLLIPQVLFTLGLAWFLAALGPFVRDLGQVMGFLLTLWFFLTPICYPEGQAPEAARGLLELNPILTLVRGYRAVLLESRAPDPASTALFAALSLGVFIAGHAWFYKLRKSFADVV